MESLTQAEQTALTWYHLSKCSRKEAFVAFARPDLMESKNKAMVDEYLKQFFARTDVRSYLSEYAATLDRFLHPTPVETQPVGSMEERKASAKKKLIEFAMSLANNIDQASDKEAVLKIADRVGLLDGEEEVIEKPRRYIPITCNQCEYRKFVEENCDRVEDGTELAENNKQHDE